MTGPCLCGDPACGHCFPSGQARVRCVDCDWEGRRYECGGEEQGDEVIDTCPLCDGDCDEVNAYGV